MSQIYTAKLAGLTNGQQYGVRVYPRSTNGQYQTAAEGATAVCTPKQGIEIRTLPVGSKVALKLGGVNWNWIVVQQGRPSSLYDASCNGAWLLLEDCYEERQWHSSNVNDYANSTIHSYLNSTFLNLFSANIKAQIKQVKFPYRPGAGYVTSFASGTNGLSAKIFLLSAPEVNWTSSTHSCIPNDGACLSYFSGCATTDSKRIAKLNGSARYWWFRSPCCNYVYGSSCSLCVASNGEWSSGNCSYFYGIRPAFVLPSDFRLSPIQNANGSYSPLEP